MCPGFGQGKLRATPPLLWANTASVVFFPTGFRLSDWPGAAVGKSCTVAVTMLGARSVLRSKLDGKQRTLEQKPQGKIWNCGNLASCEGVADHDIRIGLQCHKLRGSV